MKDKFGYDWNKTGGSQFWSQPHTSRRVFFRHLAAGVGGYFLLPSRPMETIAKAAPATLATAKNCIFILMAGAPSHCDTFDLKEGPWTPASFGPTSYGDIRFPQGLMPNLAGQIDSLAFVRSMIAPAAVHGLSQTWVQIARNPFSGLSKIAPHIGSVVSMELGPTSADRTLPAFFSLSTSTGPGNGYFPPEHAPFYVSPGGGGLGNTTHSGGQSVFERRYNMLLDMDADLRSNPVYGGATADMAAFNASARKLMYNPSVDRIFTFDQTQRNAYGNTSFGNACITARNLLRARMGARFIQITLGGWDNHVNIYAASGLPAAMRQFDTGLAALIADLKGDGLLDETLIVAMGEFGRTVGQLNTSNGRDHYLQQAALFAGARIPGRRAIGVTDKTASLTVDPGWSRKRDIRPEDIAATIYSALGIDWTTVRRDDPFGRGFEYIPSAASQDLYGPVNELWG
jgi:hypothetical protein